MEITTKEFIHHRHKCRLARVGQRLSHGGSECRSWPLGGTAALRHANMHRDQSRRRRLHLSVCALRQSARMGTRRRTPHAAPNRNKDNEEGLGLDQDAQRLPSRFESATSAQSAKNPRSARLANGCHVRAHTRILQGPYAGQLGSAAQLPFTHFSRNLGARLERVGHALIASSVQQCV